MAASNAFEGVIVSFEQDPGEKRRVDLDWTTALGALSITATAWTVDPAGGLSVATVAESGKVRSVWPTGGTIGKTYRVICHITTNDLNDPKWKWGFNVDVIDKVSAPTP